MSFAVEQCRACLHAVYPARYLCPQCHGSAWRSIPVGSGTLQQLTQLPDPRGDDACLDTLQTDAGPMVIARLAGARHNTGRRYALRLERDALIAEPDSSEP